MTNRLAGRLAAIFCATGLLSAGALAYDLQRPLTPRVRLEVPRMVQRATDLRVAEVPDLEPTSEILAPVVIVGAVAPRVTPKAPPPAPPRDISDMTCTDWLPLQQGSATQTVRLCH